jgi:hypothetical protein
MKMSLRTYSRIYATLIRPRIVQSKRKAKQTFQNAVKAAARSARDHALAILPNENPFDPLEINADITKTTINPK